MTSENTLIGLAWAVLFLVLVCMAPRALARSRPEDAGALDEDEAFLDLGGPVIDAEPA